MRCPCENLKYDNPLQSDRFIQIQSKSLPQGEKTKPDIELTYKRHPLAVALVNIFPEMVAFCALRAYKQFTSVLNQVIKFSSGNYISSTCCFWKAIIKSSAWRSFMHVWVNRTGLLNIYWKEMFSMQFKYATTLHMTLYWTSPVCQPHRIF